MSKEKQISEIAKILTEYEDCGECEKCNFLNVCGEKRLATNLYNAGYRKQEWISVDKRLPDKEGTYLTYTDKDKVDLDIFCIYPSNGTKFWSGETNGKVTHWMPLPEAPKMKGDSDAR